MSSPLSDHHPQVLGAMHLEEHQNAEHADNLAKLRAEGRSRQMKTQLMKRLSAGARTSQCSNSPISPLQFDYVNFSHPNLNQHDHSFSSGSMSCSWSSGEHSDKGHIQFTYNPRLEDAYQNDCDDWEDADGNFDPSPRPISSPFCEGSMRSSDSQNAIEDDDDDDVLKSSSPTSPKRTVKESDRFGSPFSKDHIHSPDSRYGVGDDDDGSVLNSLLPKSPRSGDLSDPFSSDTSSHRQTLGDCCGVQVAPDDTPNLHDASFALRTSLDKARGIQQQIVKSSSKLEYASMRLPALELAMGPLSASSAHTRKLCGLIDQKADPAFAVLEAFKEVQKLTPLIRAGPHKGEGIGMYLEQVASLETLLHFLRGNALHVVRLLQEAVEMLGESRVINKLSLFKFKEILATMHLDNSFLQDQPSYGNDDLEYAATHLESCFARILAANVRIIKLHAASTDKTALMPDTSLHALNCIAKKLSSFGKLRNCLSAYEKARGVVIRKSLKTLGASAQYLRHTTPEAVQALQWETLEDHISLWVQQMEVVIKLVLVPERKLISRVFDDCENALQWQACFARFALKGALQHWLRFGIAVVQSGTDPQKIFKLLDMFECMEGLKEVVENDVLSGDACKQARTHMTTLQGELMKGASRVLRAFGSQVEGDKDAEAPPNGGVMKLTSYVVNYVNCLLGESYRPLIGRVMHSEGGNTDKLKAALLHLMQALERNLEAKSKGLQEAHPALGQLFLMNNHWYIYTRSKNTELATILGTPWLKQHKQRAEKCALRYRQEGWGALLSILSGSDGLSLDNGGVSRAMLRQNIPEFEDAFAELYRIHQSWSVPDSLLRPQLGLTVLHSFVPMLAAFFGQFAAFLPAAHHMEYPPHRIQTMIAALFDVPEATLKPLILPSPATVPAKLRSFH